MNERLSKRARALDSAVYRVGRPPAGVVPVPLNVGDTFLDPPTFDLDVSEPHRYTPPVGLPTLRAALLERIRSRYPGSRPNPLEVSDVVVTPGGTAALAAVVGAIVDPGDSVIIAAPHWPLIAGIVRVASAEPMQIPLFHRDLDASELRRELDRAMHSGVRALYVNPIHNPTGRILGEKQAELLVDFARHHDLWLLSDDVYEDFVYVDQAVPRLFSMAPERTVHVGSSSKAFGIAGARLGWAAGPSGLISAATKMHLNTGYCAPRWSQRITEQALEPGGVGADWQKRARRAYAQAGNDVAKRLGVARPKGGQFLFVDVSAALDPSSEKPLTGFLQGCLADGVALAPGTSCGPFEHHVRICFTSARYDEVMRGTEILAQRMGLSDAA